MLGRPKEDVVAFENTVGKEAKTPFERDIIAKFALFYAGTTAT